MLPSLVPPGQPPVAGLTGFFVGLRKEETILFSDIQELKKVLSINQNDTKYDAKIWIYDEWATRIIEEVLNRPGFSFAERTEYYNGTGTAKLLLRSRPVFTTPTIQVWEDDSGFWGQPSGSFASTTALTFGTDFGLWIDQDDGTSRNGILVRLPTSGASFGSSVWEKPTYRQAGYLSPFVGQAFGNIKVTYSGGFTVNTLPAPIRAATDLLVARLNLIFPLGALLNSETYEDRSISYSIPDRDKLLEYIWPLIFTYRNHRF